MMEVFGGSLEAENKAHDKELAEALASEQIEAQREAKVNRLNNQSRLDVFFLGDESEKAVEIVWVELSKFIEQNLHATSEEIRLKMETLIQKMKETRKELRVTYIREKVLRRLTTPRTN